MKKLSYWASKNKIKSWLIIFVLYQVFNAIAIFFGCITKIEGYNITINNLYFILILFGVVFLFYPIKGYSKGIFKSTYKTRKNRGMLLLSLSFILTFSFSNFLLSSESKTNLNSYAIQTKIIERSYPNKKTKIPFGTEKIRRPFKKIAIYSLSKVQKIWNKKTSSFEKVLLIIGVSILFLAIMGGILVLACAAVCGGANGLVIALLVAGTIGSISLFIFAIRKILGKRKKISLLIQWKQ